MSLQWPQGGVDIGAGDLAEPVRVRANSLMSGATPAAGISRRDQAGVWLVMLASVGANGTEHDSWFFSGRLAGFVVVYDRDEDGTYESVGHIWTATAWQRRGNARRLLAEARSRFSITTVEEPYTAAGTALLNSPSVSD